MIFESDLILYEGNLLLAYDCAPFDESRFGSPFAIKVSCYSSPLVIIMGNLSIWEVPLLVRSLLSFFIAFVSIIYCFETHDIFYTSS